MHPAEHIEPDVDLVPLKWCCECKRKTLFTYDLDGYPICREHEEEEVCHD